MTTAQLVILSMILLIIGLSLFALGWNLAVSRHRAGRQRLEAHVSDLEVQIAAFNEARAIDPQRAWVNNGALYALGQIEQTARQIRADIEGRTP